MDFFHTLNRGVDKRNIFLDDKDRFRFVHDLYEFNDQNRVFDVGYRANKSLDIASQDMKKKRKLLVDIHCFCLMGNHYHLLLSPRVENGISRFMKKLNMGYAKYFNQKYKRKGALFEGRYKSVAINTESHFIHIPYYIHLNPLDFVSPDWRNRTIKNSKAAIEFLENYRWSSFLDYLGRKNFPSITNRSFLLKFFKGTGNHRVEVLNWIKGMDFNSIKNLALEQE
ncbi:MAG: hypothetical protein A3I92_02345 [Candidatus Yanofskybacteria bacterium RIFCSPLOWO2_02_FULL_43_10b]|uniref:Transposase IS200-like domain-containing protein n=1 Tax=Candidatus Yanofskybacteria bacterium RIFCSPLOWO2_02_FULL_43_10b TaxID=1802704 RepID=A0A1F8GYY4_9BACT|nr:MAG: hypothetical protein A3I92_02345 [Candidatus Yanofskybacteria bacterium RIFCSPLOWO2_02_FULL_43_10b]